MSRRPRPSGTTREVGAATTPSERRPVAAQLRALRQASGISQTELAARLKIGQGRVSRLELETVLPTTDLVTRYLDALGVTSDVRQDILDELVEERVEVATWRRLHRAGLRQHQERYGAMERSATAIRDWTDRVVPGLLQTPDYIRAMCRVWNVPGLSDVEGIVAGRLERQKTLHDRTKRFSFLLGEAVLRTHDVSGEVMQDQLDTILLASLMSHVELGVVPLGAMLPCSTGFMIMDNQTVTISLDTREVVIHEDAEVARYLDIFERLRDRAVRGEALAELLRDVRRNLAGTAE